MAYRFADVYDQGDGLDFTAADLGYPIVNYENPLTGTAIPKWGWGYGDFTVSAWFRGSIWGDVNQPSWPTVPGPCGLAGPGLVECNGACVPILHCEADFDVCSTLAPKGYFESCHGSCAVIGSCGMMWGPTKVTPFNQTLKVDFARGLDMPEVDYVFLFSKAIAGMTLPGPTIILYEDDRIQFRMNDAEPWTLNTQCDGCLSQGQWAMLTFIRRSDVLKVYVDGELWAEKEVRPFYVMNQANIRWGANHVFEEGQNMDGWLDDIRFYDFALNDEGVKELLNTTSSLDCFDVVPPLHGSWGTCGDDGYLPHEQGCFLTCALGFKVYGDHPYCSFGLLLNNSIQCLPVVMGDNCTDSMAENFAPEVPRHLDDGSCNYTCPTLQRIFELPGPADICRVYNPNNWFEWQGLLGVGEDEVGVLQGSSMMSQFNGRVELASGSTLLMRRAVVQHQHGTFGGAVESTGGTLILDLCLFQYNVADYFYVLAGAGHGGALYFHDGGRIQATSSQFLHNAAQVGGAVALDSASEAWFEDCQFASNTAYQPGVEAGGGAAWSRVSSLRITNSAFSGNSAGGVICVDDDFSIVASNFGAFGVADCATAKLAVDLSGLTCDDNLFDCCGIWGVGDGTLRSVCPGSCGDCGVGGTWVSDGFRPFRGLAETEGPEPPHVGGTIAVDRGDFELTGNTVYDGAADLGTEIYLVDMDSWVIRDTVLRPFDPHNTVVTLRCPLAGCSEHPCALGYNCEYRNYTTVCNKCTPNLASVDGIRCTTCPSGYGPADNGTRCDRCPPRLYSNTITGVVCSPCAPGSEATPAQDECALCPAGTHSPDGMGCVPCPPGLEPVATLGAASCVRCPPGSFSVNGSVCTPCASGAEPLSVELYHQKLNQTEPWSPFELPRYDRLDELTAPPDAVQLRHGDFAEPLAWCSNGLGWNRSDCEEGTCLDYNDHSLLYDYLPAPGCGTDDDATVKRTLIAADNCTEALQILESVGYSCFSDLRPAGFDFGLQPNGYRRTDHDGSLSFVCPNLCGICPYETPIMNMTMTEEDSHNLTLCEAANNTCAQEWHWPRQTSYGWPVTGPTTLINITGPVKSSWQNCASGESCAARDPSDGAAVAACSSAVLDGTEAACVAAGDCVYTHGDFVGLDGRECEQWGIRDPAGTYGMHPTSHSCSARVYTGFAQTGSRPWCYVRDSVCIKRRVSSWRAGEQYVVAASGSVCLSCENLGEDMHSTGDPEQPCESCEPGTQPNLGRTGCDVCPSGRVSPFGFPCVACPNGTEPDPHRVHCQSCVTHGETFASNGTQCNICPNGTQPDTNRSSCQPCPIGWVAPEGQLCDICPDGKEPDGRNDPLLANASTNTYCTDCRPGYAGRDGVCTICPFGDMPNPEASWCVDCPPGYSGHAWRSGRCVMCSDGYHPVRNQTICERCPPGTAGTSGFCYPCLSGTKENLSSAACMPCPPGQAGLDGFCTTCDDGSQPDHLLSTCELCPVGRAGVGGFCAACPYGAEPRQNRTICGNCSYDMVSLGDECVTCESGFGVDELQSRCLDCPAGLYSSEELLEGAGARTRINVTNRTGNHQGVFCETCAPGYEPEANGTAPGCASCRTFGPAFHSLDGVSCLRCAAGSEPNDARSLCNPCVPGWAGSDGTCHKCPAGNEPSLDRSECRPCEDTFAGTDGFCAQCANGKMPNDGHTACIPCPRNFAGMEGECEKCIDAKEPNVVQTHCQPCASNAAGTNGFCEECPSGAAPSPQGNSPEPPQTVCESCLINAAGIDGVCTTCGDGEQANELRISCVDCPPGRAGYTGMCEPCEGGQEPNEEKTECLDCPSGMVSATGIRCDYCTPGYETNEDQTECLECPTGKFSNAGPPWNQPRCSICEPGNQPASPVKASGCVACVSLGLGYASTTGVMCEVCPAGKEPNHDQTGCEFCEEGAIRAGTPAEMSNVVCELCPHGKSAWARQSCEMCGTNEQGRNGVCYTCPDGKQPSVTHTSCERCPVGYAGVNGRCYRCDDAETPSEDLTGCEWCPIGYRGDSGECFPCMSGYQPSIDRGGTEEVMWRHGTRCDECSPGRAGVDGVCGFCDPGFRPSTDRTVCLPCLPNSYSTDGVNCTACPLNTDTRNFGTITERFACKCSTGMYDAVITSGMLECYNEKGQLTDTVNPEVTAATDCYPCPSCYACGSESDNTNPQPSRGYWRRSDSDRQLVRCTADAAISPCLGGASEDGGPTPCEEGYEGLVCGSCKLGYEHHAGSGECRQCPEKWVSVLWTCISTTVLLGCAGIMGRKTRQCAKPPTIDDVLRMGQNDLEVIVQCARILLAFLQVQALIGSYALNWPATMVLIFEYGSMPADPYFIAQSAYCLRTIAGEDFVYLRAMLIIGLPFMVAAVIGTWYGWLHLTSIGCKADPSLTYVAEAKEVLEEENEGQGDADGVVSTDLVMKDLDEDHDGKVTKDEFKHFWKKHKHDHINKKELLMADTIILIFFIYPSIVREVFSFFSCEDRGPGLWLLSADTGVECYSAKHSLWMTFIGIPGIVFFCGVLPLLAVGKLKHMKRYALLEDMNMVRKFGFLYRGYEEDYCYWEILVTARKIAIVFIAVFFKSYGAMVQGIASLCVIQAALLLNVVYGPYDYGVQDRIETLSLATSFFTVLGGLFFENRRDKTGGEEKMNMVSVSVEVAVIVINATVIVAMLTIVLKPIMSRCQQKRYCSCKRLIENIYPRAYYWQPKPPDTTKVAPVVSVGRNDGSFIADGGITSKQRREDNTKQLNAKQHANEEAAHVLHQLEGALKGMKKYMPELDYELTDMLRSTDRIADLVGERTRLTRDVARSSHIELESHPMNARFGEQIISEEEIPLVPTDPGERIRLMFRATVDDDVTVLQDLFDEDGINLDAENRAGQTAIDVARERECHLAYNFLNRVQNGLQEKSEKAKRLEERQEREKDPTMDEYIVHVYTANERWAGTDANVYMNLVGQRAQTGMTPLNKGWRKNAFERGKIDQFTIESKLGQLGELRGVVVNHDGSGMSSEWLLEKVVVTPPGRGALPVCFRADRWLGKSKGRGDTDQERCTAELFPVAGEARASTLKLLEHAPQPEPEPQQEFFTDSEQARRAAAEKHQALRKQLEYSTREEDAAERADRAEERAEREALSLSMEMELPVTPPTETSGALPGQVGAGRVEDVVGSSDEEDDIPNAGGALLLENSESVALDLGRRR